MSFLSAGSEPIERSRSNSESVINASIRSARRMGFVVRRTGDLSTVAESAGKRNAAGAPQLPVLNFTSLGINGPTNGNSSTTNISPPLDQPNRRRSHARGVSHDSIMDYPDLISNNAPPRTTTTTTTTTEASTKISTSNASTTHHSNKEVPDKSERHSSTSNTRNESEALPNAYFRRLSVLQEQISPTTATFSNAVTSTHIVESARGVLFSVSQVLPAVKQYLVFCDDRKLTGTLGGILYNTKLHIDTLIRALDRYDSILAPAMINSSSAANARRPGTAALSAAVDHIVQATLACIAALRHVISIMHANIKTITARAEVRHTRAFFMLMYGTLAEINNCWNSLVPALVESRASPAAYLRSGTITAISASGPSSQSSTKPPESIQPLSLPLSLPTPSLWPQATKPVGIPATPLSAVVSSPGLFLPSGLSSPMTATMSTPSTENGPFSFNFPAEPSAVDDELFQKISIATSAALNVLNVIHEGISKPSYENDLRIRELSGMCDVGLEVTSRLRVRLKTIREADDAERGRFGDETNSFVKVVINILEFTKTIMNEYPFLHEARPALSTLTRMTKEVLTVTLKPAEKPSTAV
ncbi:RAM signaling pathway protein-domain-containing protein [Lipomyces japonicus]|uniref:RAM signaling pathway protein-domain-containing protein n=1 Tax=Lipomyces japonicus TaxID=56871 RepID=UPI0034CD7FF8